MLEVTNEVRFTGETIYTVSDEQGKVANVTSDGFFRRNSFYGYIQDRGDKLIETHGKLGEELLDAVQRYIESK